jgi:hypothetical protein
VLLTACLGCFQAPPPAPPKTVVTGPGAATTPGGQQSKAAPQSAGEILARLLQTYRSAQAYQDQGVVKLQFSQAGTRAGDEWPCAVQFVRPGKLSVVAFQATIKCDGRELRARIEDEPTGNLDGQVLVRTAPERLKLADLASDAILYDVLCSQLRRQPIQLELLLESAGLAAAFGKDVAAVKLEDGQADGRDCFRVEVPTPGGPFVFWIDKQDSLLRRLDYPAAALLPQLAGDPTVSDLRLWADLSGAKIGGPIADETFTLEVPEAAKRMQTFVAPLQPLPSQLLGQEVGEFFFTELAGGKLTDTGLSGRVAVLAWYHDDPACEATMQQVAAARARLADDDAVNFYAVATDPTTAGNDELMQTLARWKVDLPIVRDLEAFGDKTFQIKGHPTIVVLDEKNRVQIFQVGGHPQLADQLVEAVGQLKTGTDIAALALAAHQRERKAYEELLAKGGPEPGQVVELPEAVIRQRSQPKTLKLTELWTCRDVKSPGNFLLVEQADQPPRVFVVEGWRTVTELAPDGKVVARHELDLPERAAITYVRTATGKSGERLYAAAAPLAAQFYLFDAQWQRIATFPKEGQTPLAVTDLAFADVGDADGSPEVLAASVADIGLVAFGQDGAPVWRNAKMPNAFSLAVSPAGDMDSWAIFLAGEQGTVLRVNRFGHEEPPRTIGQWPIFRLTAARFPGATQAAMLGLSNNPQGQPVAVGVTAQLKEAWNYPLPAGTHQRPIEQVTSGNLLPGRTGEWWLAAPDGSIHVVSEDGELHDSFNYGAVLTGLAAAKLGEQAVLLVATDEGVTAWKVE